jgi:hypothetical protein
MSSTPWQPYRRTGARRRRLRLALGVGERHGDAGEVSWLAGEAPASSGHGGARAKQWRSNGGCRGAARKKTEGEVTKDGGEDDGESGRQQRTHHGSLSWPARRDGRAEHRFCLLSA